MARRPNTITARIALDGGKELERELKALGLAGEVAFRKLRENADKLNKTGLDPFITSIKRAQKTLEDLGKKFDRIGRDFTNVGRRMSLAITAPIVGGFGLAVKAATDFEAALVDVQKVVDFPTPDSLVTFGEEIRKLAPQLNVANSELLAIAAAAGQSGVAFDELLEFTALVAKASVALELSFAETGSSLAKIKTALGLTVPEVARLADAINELGDKTGASESEIIAIVQEVAPLGKQAGITKEQIAALGASMITLGADSESAGTAIRNLLLELVSGESGTAEFKNALLEIGLTSTEVAERMQTDGIGTILDIFDRIQAQAPAVRLALTNALFGRRAVASIAGLTGNLNEFRRALGLVSKEAEFAGSVNQTFALRAETASFKFGALRKDLENLAITIGNELLPVVVDVSAKIAEFVKGIGDSDAVFKRWGIGIALAVAAIGPLLFGLGQIALFIGPVLRLGVTLLKQFAAIATAFKVGGLAAAALATPLGALVAAIAAVTVGVALFATRNSEAGAAARAHRDALVRLDEMVAQSKAGVEGATEATREYAEGQIAAARAVLEQARAEAARFQIINEFGQEQEQVVGGVDITTARDQLAFISEIEKRLDDLTAAQVDRIQAAKGDKEIVAGLQATEKAVEDLGKTTSGFPKLAGTATKSVSDAFAGVKTEAETTSQGVRAAVATVSKEWQAQGAAAAAAGAEGTKAAATITRDLGKAGAEITRIQPAIGALTGEIAKVGPALAEAGTAASGALEPVNQAFVTAAANAAQLGTTATESVSGIQQAVTDTAGTLSGPFKTATDEIASAFTSAFGRVKSELNSLVSAVDSAISRMTAALARLRAAIASAKAAAASSGSGGGGGSGGGFASGGRVWGAGTSTSDSILARLSRGEFVVKTRAVEHYGPQLFAALNSMRLPKDLLKGFNMGGIVRGLSNSMAAMSPIPAFASGGEVGGFASAGRPFTVVLPSGEKVEGMTASNDAVDQFMRFARTKAVMSAGKKPGWRR